MKSHIPATRTAYLEAARKLSALIMAAALPAGKVVASTANLETKLAVLAKLKSSDPETKVRAANEVSFNEAALHYEVLALFDSVNEINAAMQAVAETKTRFESAKSIERHAAE